MYIKFIPAESILNVLSLGNPGLTNMTGLIYISCVLTVEHGSDHFQLCVGLYVLGCTN